MPTLESVVAAAGLRDPQRVMEKLSRNHGVATVADLKDVLGHPEAAQDVPTLWRCKLADAVTTAERDGHTHTHASEGVAGGTKLLSWPLKGEHSATEIAVMQGDLTSCSAGAIVNPANSKLKHIGGVAGAVVNKGGPVIQKESDAWIAEHSMLPVGKAMSTTAGRLPCRYVIHTVGPMIGGGGEKTPTAKQAKLLRSAVKNALAEAERLRVSSIAIPGISSGIFGYPRDLAAREIAGECVRYFRSTKGRTDHTQSLGCIVLMDNDSATCDGFKRALLEADEFDEDKFDFRHQTAHSSKSPDAGQDLQKAAGVLLCRAGEADLEVLLGIEYRMLDNPPGRFVNILGGKRKVDSESAEDVASREFSEEVGGLLTEDQVKEAMDGASRSIYLPFAKYTLFIVHVDTKQTHNLPELFAQRKLRSNTGPVSASLEHDHIFWVPWENVLHSLSPPTTHSTSQTILLGSASNLHTPHGSFELSAFMQRLLKGYSGEVVRHIEALTMRSLLDREVSRMITLKTKTNDEIIEALLEADWKLHLTSPPMPPPPPFELLAPSDPEHGALLKELSSPIASRVLSVRRVRHSARLGDFNEHKRTLERRTDLDVEDKEPFFHGTPDRWRATAIAINGFDLSIRLCGRSKGDGVYTSTNPSVCAQYTGNSGSILRLRGLVTSGSPNSTENTIVGGHMHVFPNPKVLLPLLIADYTLAGDQDEIEAARREVEASNQESLARRRAMQDTMIVEEKSFKDAVGQRLRTALDVYRTRLEQMSSMLPSSDLDGLDTSISLHRRFFTERRHFRTCLPIYELKLKLIDILRVMDVVIVVADTGSGKSTQLPQILLDDVLDPAEHRRIAVLEPRRVNAVSLCKRVSDERGIPPGQEVGYTIGRGESNVAHSVTRLEYMTHGLFVQLARNYDQLLNNYCAVIVDEAHERSVDVDLSLALLRRVMERRSLSSGLKSFKVIVTSATIGNEALAFQTYLDPNKNMSSVFRVPGRTFPVHIEHRNDIQVDPSRVGTAGVGKVMTSAAIQTALELLRTTESGNILIFLPGEGSINDALETARNEIASSATVEALDTFGSASASFCFRFVASKPAQDDNEEEKTNVDASVRRVITTYVVAFHGKITRAERDHVLYPPSRDWRLVVFTTNVAETGVTIPNVRYVIDTGLQRSVRWNATLDMNEMVTERISPSSMLQRSGRAGRTASGICVRLYPEQSTDGLIQATTVPGVQNAMIYKAVLLNKQLEDEDEIELTLMDPIEPEVLQIAEDRLVQLGALDEDHKKLTHAGIALLRIGIDLRLGRFLIACARLGCLASGVKLASLLVSADAPERLLPHRTKDVHRDSVQQFIDPSGDHITLLNIVEAFDAEDRKQNGITWCQENGFDYDVFLASEASKEYLLKVLDSLRFPLADDKEMIDQAGGKNVCIKRALCAAYCDQLARPRMSGTAKDGFTRVLDEGVSTAFHHNATEFSAKTQPVPLSDDGNNSNINVPDGATISDANSVAEPIVRLASNSTLWCDAVASHLVTSLSCLVVFGSLMLTDSAKRGEPTVQLLTCVTDEDVRAGAPEWCRSVDFDQLIASSARETLEYELAPGMRQTMLMERGAWLGRLRKMFHSAVLTTIRKGKLLVSCPRRSLAHVEHQVRKQLHAVEPEPVVLQLPDHVNMGKIVGKGGQLIQKLEASIQELLSSELSGAGRYHVQQRILSIDTTNKAIKITLQGASKPLMGVVVGRIQSAIVEIHGKEMLPLVLDASGERGQQIQKCPRLAQLLNRVTPSNWTTRDDIMLQLAHALVWRCNASVYGGFVRDWVVRGELANDIDVELAPPLTTVPSIEQSLSQFLSTNDGARSKALHIAKRGNKGAAFTLTIGGHGIKPVDIDLVDRKKLSPVIAPPGVDSDAGNLLLNRVESLRKKIPSAGDSLSAALENIQAKRFMFYYPFNDPQHQDMSVKRLKKYLSRGWTCLTDVPHTIQKQFLSEDERQLIEPLPDGA